MSQSQKKDAAQAEIPKDDKKKEEVKGANKGKDNKKDPKAPKEEELVRPHISNNIFLYSLKRTSN